MAAFHVIAQILRQDQRVVVRFIMGRIEKCHCAALHQKLQSCNLVLIAFEFRPVTARKLAIALWIVTKPLAQS